MGERPWAGGQLEALPAAPQYSSAFPAGTPRQHRAAARRRRPCLRASESRVAACVDIPRGYSCYRHTSVRQALRRLGSGGTQCRVRNAGCCKGKPRCSSPTVRLRSRGGDRRPTRPVARRGARREPGSPSRERIGAASRLRRRPADPQPVHKSRPLH